LDKPLVIVRCAANLDLFDEWELGGKLVREYIEKHGIPAWNPPKVSIDQDTELSVTVTNMYSQGVDDFNSHQLAKLHALRSDRVKYVLALVEVRGGEK
jgi:hypothetical protein